MKYPYTHTVLRYVHDTTTGEFINVGVAIYSREGRYASALCRSTLGRISKTFPGVNGEAFKSLMRYIQSRMEEIGDGLQNHLPFEGFPGSVMELAHQVLPPDDSALQWSPPGSGLAEDLPQTLESLYQRYVARYDDPLQQERRSDEEVWRKFRRNFEARHLLKHLQPKRIAGQNDEIEFQHAWQNGVWHCLEPVSFDLISSESIRRKAHNWLGQMMSIRDSTDQFKLYLLLGEPQREALRPAFEKAVGILGNLPVENEIIREFDAEGFSSRLAQKIESHTRQG